MKNASTSPVNAGGPAAAANSTTGHMSMTGGNNAVDAAVADAPLNHGGNDSGDTAAADAPPNHGHRKREAAMRIFGRLTVFGLTLAYGIDRLVQLIEDN